MNSSRARRSYTDMLVEANDARWIIHNVCAGISTWILLAAFLIIPGTFTSIRDSSLFQNVGQTNDPVLLKEILQSITHVGLLSVAGIFYTIGLFGCFFLWRVWRGNYIWLNEKLFLSTLLNSTAGLLSTIVNIYTSQRGSWSITAKVTIAATGTCILVSGTAFLVYSWLLNTHHCRQESPGL